MASVEQVKSVTGIALMEDDLTAGELPSASQT
jgi:hypothetical protein